MSKKYILLYNFIVLIWYIVNLSGFFMYLTMFMNTYILVLRAEISEVTWTCI